MFDDENENWDNIEIDNDASSDELSWDEILDNAVVHDDSEEENNVNLQEPHYDEQDFVQENTQQDFDNNQTYNVAEDDDEPLVETTSQSRETDNVSETYAEGVIQQEYGAGNEQDIQEADSAGVEENPENADAPDMKPIGIRQDKGGSQTPVILGIVVAIALAAVGYMGYTYLNNNGLIPKNSIVQDNDKKETQNTEDEDLFEDFGTDQASQDNSNANTDMFDAGSFGNPQGPEAPVAENKEDRVVVSVVNVGRPNPFTPTGNFSEAGYTVPKGLDIMGTPALDKDVTPNKLVDIVVSGILYDNTKPSAIITIGGIDHFVQRGDSIDEYVVSYIGPTSVTIRSGKNTYTANIGQQFNVNDKIKGETTFVKGKNGTTRQYFTPSEEDIIE